MGQQESGKRSSIFRLQTKLQNFWHQVICRKIPHTLISWRFLWPGDDRAVLWHRRVFLDAWCQHGRLLQYSILIYSILIWFAWQSWRQVFRSWSNLSPKLYEKLAISRSRQFCDLLRLALLHGIPPIYYYQLRLFQQPPRRWLSFIYNHELPQWHLVMAKMGTTISDSEAQAERELIGDKFAFAKKMSQNQIAAIPTGSFISKGTKPDPKQIFREKKLFLKPNRANQCRNCYELHYDQKGRDYELHGIRSRCNPDQRGQKELELVIGQANIITRLAQLTRHEDFLIQPLLTNHPEIVKVFAVERLVTIRFITGHDGQKVRPLSAALEVPHQSLQKGWHLYTIDLENGRAHLGEHPLFPRDDKPEVQSFTTPDWPGVVDLPLRAHALLPALPTIGWDLAVCDQEPIIIEANFNWGVNQAQILSGEPLLQGGLLDVYEKRAGKGGKS
ncbi:hypothetical protein KAI46_16790 [bacterium]|nr:hypothetical protein [bacterium]